MYPIVSFFTVRFLKISICLGSDWHYWAAENLNFDILMKCMHFCLYACTYLSFYPATLFQVCYFSRIIPGNNVYNAYLFLFCFVISVISIKSVLWRTCFQRSRDVEVLRWKFRAVFQSGAYFILFHKVHKSCPFDLHWLSLSVIKRQDEVEKIGFSEVGWRLFLIMRPCQTNSAAEKTRHQCGLKQQAYTWDLDRCR